MIKKKYLSFALSFTFIAPVVAMTPAATPAEVAALTVQLNHINTQMNAIKRAWNVERVHIQMAKKASADLYNAIRPTFEKLIMSPDFTATMDATITMQFDAIVNKNESFKNIKTDNNLSDLFPNLKMSDYGVKLYKAMANKAYFVLLGQKLADKVKEITAQIKNSQLAPTGTEEAIGQSVM